MCRQELGEAHSPESTRIIYEAFSFSCSLIPKNFLSVPNSRQVDTVFWSSTAMSIRIARNGQHSVSNSPDKGISTL